MGLWKQPTGTDRTSGLQPRRLVKQKLGWVWEEFGEPMDTDFRLAQRRFWHRVRWLKQGKPCFSNTVYSEVGVLLTSDGDVIRRWKKCFEDLLNPTNTSFTKEDEQVDSEMCSSITGAEIIKVVKKICGGRD